jgi:hypothetical protein
MAAIYCSSTPRRVEGMSNADTAFSGTHQRALQLMSLPHQVAREGNFGLRGKFGSNMREQHKSKGRNVEK